MRIAPGALEIRPGGSGSSPRPARPRRPPSPPGRWRGSSGHSASSRAKTFSTSRAFARLAALSQSGDGLRLVLADQRGAPHPRHALEEARALGHERVEALLERQVHVDRAQRRHDPLVLAHGRGREERLAVAEMLEDRALGHTGALGHALGRGAQLALLEKLDHGRSTTASRVRSARTVRPSRAGVTGDCDLHRIFFFSVDCKFRPVAAEQKNETRTVRLRSAPTSAEAGGSRGGPHTSWPRSLRIESASLELVEQRRRTGSRGNRQTIPLLAGKRCSRDRCRSGRRRLRISARAILRKRSTFGRSAGSARRWRRAEARSRHQPLRAPPPRRRPPPRGRRAPGSCAAS